MVLIWHSMKPLDFGKWGRRKYDNTHGWKGIWLKFQTKRGIHCQRKIIFVVHIVRKGLVSIELNFLRSWNEF